MTFYFIKAHNKAKRSFSVSELLRKMMVTVLVIGVVVSFSIAWKYAMPKHQAWRDNAAQRDALQAEVDQIREQITQTKRNIDRFKSSPYFVERLARMNHRVADNEIVFIFQ